MTEVASVRTEPPGADVAIRDSRFQTEWRPVGRTPIEGARIPRGVLRWRIQKAGFDTVELIGGAGRALLGALPSSIALTATGSVPPEMVRIPDGPLGSSSPGLASRRSGSATWCYPAAMGSSSRSAVR